MPILNVVGRGWSGAAAGVVRPITSADCTIYPTFEELVRSEGAVSRGCTVRQGRGWAKRTVAEISSSCYAVPAITSYVAGTRTLVGVRFYTKTGPAKFEVNVGAGWVVRATDVWTSTLIHHAAPILVPGNKLRVTNSYGLVSNEWTV